MKQTGCLVFRSQQYWLPVVPEVSASDALFWTATKYQLPVPFVALAVTNPATPSIVSVQK
ncbi:hypothetical protein [Acidocella sp.]|uniref:hypothetical protein n=1 Tax=Acidocella sp. TaxID=50710 RepID=UPI00261B25D2|nr:hypothetical protein [Acidocella sp.]